MSSHPIVLSDNVHAANHEKSLMYFGANEIRNALTYDMLISEMRKALIDLSAGRATQPLRTMIAVPEHNGRYGVMSAVYGEVMGTKMLSIYPDNGRLHLQSHVSTIQLFNASQGQALATMDGDVITEMRTAAVSALAADLLAPPNARTLAILGTGVQARSHLAALRPMRRFDELYLWNRDHAKASRWATQVGGLAVETVRDAVSLADVIVTATNTHEPILKGSFLKPECLVISVGAVHPQMRELDDAVMQGALIVESREAAQHESGDIILSGSPVYAELGEILGKSIDLPASFRRVFKSVGVAIEDVAAAYLAYRQLTGSAQASPEAMAQI